MKRIYLLFSILLLLCINITQAQTQTNKECGTKLLPGQQQILDEISLLSSKQRRIPDETIKKVALTIHIIRRSDGSGGISEQRVLDDIKKANAWYNKSYLEFFAFYFNYIDDDTYYSFAYQRNYEIGNKYDIYRTINIYYAPTLGPYCGFAYYPGGPDRIFMANGCSGPNENTLAHELGHSFSLIHTHGHSNIVLTDELVDGSNCITAGDDICDTPADPQLNRYPVNYSTCVYFGTVVDANGDLFQPNTKNIMSYAPHRCPDHFSPMQHQRMNTTYYSHRSYMYSSNQFVVSVDVSPNEGGTVNGNNDFSYTHTYADNVTLIAVAEPGYRFLNWTENTTVISEETLLSFTITKNRNLKGNFEPIPISCSFTLIDAITDLPIPEYDPIPEGATINTFLLPSTINIVANQTTSGSASMILTGAFNKTRTENYAPYAMFGDNGKGDFSEWTPIIGEYSLTTTTFTEKRTQGKKVKTCTINFSFYEDQYPELDMTMKIPVGEYKETVGTCIDIPIIITDEDVADASVYFLDIKSQFNPNFRFTITRGTIIPGYPETEELTVSLCIPDIGIFNVEIGMIDETTTRSQLVTIEVLPITPQVTSFTLVDAENDVVILEYDPILDFAEIDISLLSTKNLNVVANISAELTGSVKFYLDGRSSKVESKTPFALKGDNGKGNFYNWYPLGKYTIAAETYTEKRAKGEVGMLYEINVNFVDNSATTARIGSDSNQSIDKISTELLLDLYPNPSNDILNIKVTNRIKDETHLLIYNVNGAIIYEDKFNEIYNNQLNTSNFTNGMYTLKLISNKTQLLRKIIIMH